MGDSHSSRLVPHPCCGLMRRRVVEKTPMCVKTPHGIQTEPPLMCLHFQYHTGLLVHSINVLLFLSLWARINLYRLVFQEECACWYRFLQENSSPLIGVSFIWTLMGGAMPISPCMMISWGVAALNTKGVLGESAGWILGGQALSPHSHHSFSILASRQWDINFL